MDLPDELSRLPLPETVSRGAVVPLAEEELHVGKRVVETGTVRLTKHLTERTEVVEVPLTAVQWQVERMPMDVVVQEVPAQRQEGETTIYPVVEERLVLRRELVLVEEVRVTRREKTSVEIQSHVLRREEILEERIR